MEAISQKEKRGPAIVRDSTELLGTKTRATAEAGGKKGHFYRPLPTEFRHDGFTYRHIAREYNASIYEQCWNRCRNPNVAYELVRIRRWDGFYICVMFL